MAEVAYDTILKEVSPFVPNCPEPVMVNAIRNTAIDFCDFTGWLTQDLDPITVIANEAFYELEADGDYEVARVMDPMWFQGAMVRVRTELELRRTMTSAWATMTAIKPTHFTQLSPNEIRLVPIPTVTAASALTGRIVVKPLRISTTVDEKLFEHHAEAIAAGALERITVIPDEAYSSGEKSKYYAHKYRSLRAKVRIAVSQAFGEAEQRVSIPRSW